jgi:hypothetical protein
MGVQASAASLTKGSSRRYAFNSYGLTFIVSFITIYFETEGCSERMQLSRLNRSVDPLDQYESQSINHRVSQSVSMRNQSVSMRVSMRVWEIIESIIEYESQSVWESVSMRVNMRVSHRVSQSIIESVSQSVSQSVIESHRKSQSIIEYENMLSWSCRFDFSCRAALTRVKDVTCKPKYLFEETGLATESIYHD